MPKQRAPHARTPKRLPGRFYATASGNEPARDWLRTLAPADQVIVGTDIGRVEYGWPDAGPPLTKGLGGGLWEVRSTIKGGKVEARVYFALDTPNMILLHGSDDKSGQDRDIKLARERWSDYQNRKATPKSKKKGT